MSVQDYDINVKIDKIADHVDTMLNNEFVRKGFSRITIDREYQSGMDILLSRSESYKVNGYLFDELYRGIMGLAMWSYRARTEFLPQMKYHLSDDSKPQTDRIREQMALENLNSNLSILADEVNELFLKVVAADKAAHKLKPPVFQRMKELENLGQLLTSDTKGLIH